MTGRPRAADRRITVLGATGSVGRATLDVIAGLRAREGQDACPIEALTARGRWDELAQLARAFRPRLAVIAEPELGPALAEALAGTGVETAAGAGALVEAAERPADWVMAGIVGAAGLAPTLAAARRGALVALANKEALVCAGRLLTETIAKAGGALLPVDSEHNAIFQVLPAEHRGYVERLILTASGGPFRDWPLARMAQATPAEAINHPTWAMGAKISVDCATLMNKGLELIEARMLFDVAPHQLDALIHPQSVVHSLVAYVDGSVLAQLGSPDMRVPIASALGWPERLATDARRLELSDVAQLTFARPDESRFPALALARAALEADGDAPAALNAANEVAVARFLDRRIGFLDISRVVERVLSKRLAAGGNGAGIARDLDDVLEIDRAARREAAAAADECGAP